MDSRAKFSRDLLERILATFGQAFIAQLIASGVGTTGIVDISIGQKAGIAGIAGVLALLKGILAKKVGNVDSASLSPGV